MFRYARQRQAFWPVDLPYRTDDGLLKTERVRVLYELFSRDELLDSNRRMQRTLAQRLADWSKDGKVADLDAMLAEMADEERKELDKVLARIKGWREGDIVDAASKEPLPYSAELVRDMCEDMAIYQALHAGLLAASRGAAAKN